MARNPENGKSELVENLSYEDWHKKYVESAINNNQNNRVINFFDSIDEWKEVPKGEAKKSKIYKVGNMKVGNIELMENMLY